MNDRTFDNAINNLTGISGSGDVVGPGSATDNAIVIDWNIYSSTQQMYAEHFLP
mgnify:CR=1 FL=1